MSDDEIDPDLEERLYAQIHHQEDDSYVEPAPTAHRDSPELQLSIDIDPIKRRFLHNRYWAETPTVTRSGLSRPPPNTRAPPRGRITTASVLGIAGKMADGPQAAMNKPVEVTGFKAYSSILQSMSAPPDPSKNFRKPQNVSKKGQRLDNLPDNQLSKLERVQKYLAKAQRAEAAKKKSKKQQQLPPVTTISLDSSSSEDDDVIEIPVPPPPLVCLDDSSDDSMQAPPTLPQATPRSANPARASRCSSPSSSIISDDFIAPLDRNCLSDSMDSVNMTEEDQRAAKAKTSVAQTLEKKKKDAARSKKQATVTAANVAVSESAANGNNKAARQRIPLLYKNLISSQKDVTIAHYHEDASNADDVVLVANAEREAGAEEVEETICSSSSTPQLPSSSSGGSTAAASTKKSRSRSISTGDSVYAKGLGSSGRSKKVAATPVESSDSEADAGVSQNVNKPNKTQPEPTPTPPLPAPTTTTKVRIARKRKSITEDSSHSETEPPPFIHSGEAVDKAQSSPKRREGKKRQRLNTLTKTPGSDNAFMSMISTIAQGGDVSDSDSVELLPSTIEEVTIHSSEEHVGSDTGRPSGRGVMTFNEFPHESVLKLVPIERREVRDEWFVSDADRMGPQQVARIRCLNCHQMGHIRARCPMPYKPPVCYMCGETGHLEPRCRKTICLMCGSNTRTYQIRCQECQNMNNSRCSNCRAVGHAAWICPERWRRYHDTTEDVVKLTPLYGPLIKKPKYCSVCGRRGHTVDDCKMSPAFLDFRPASMLIVKYSSIYPNSRMNVREERRPPSRNRAVEEDSNEVRKREKERRRSDREERRSKRREEEESQVIKEVVVREVETVMPEPDPSDRAEKLDKEIEKPQIDEEPEKVPVAFKITVDVQSDERQVTSTTKNTEAVPPSTTRDPPIGLAVARKMSPNSDSNYSFSEFFEKDKQQQQQSLPVDATIDSSERSPAIAEKVLESSSTPSIAHDFISINSSAAAAVGTNEASSSPSLVSSSLQGQQPSSVGVESEARIYLSKEHSKMLINSKGSEFLRETSALFNLRVRLEWQSVGNLLTVAGLEEQQTAFHEQLTQFLNHVEDRSEGSANQLPLRRDLLIRAIKISLSKLKENLGNVYDLHRTQGRDVVGRRGKKENDKARRTLNMILIGQAGLRDGHRRLTELKQSLALLVRQEAVEGPERVSSYVDADLRKEIWNNFHYVFGSLKHDNYGDLLRRYNQWRRQKNAARAAEQNKEQHHPPFHNDSW